MGEVEPDRERIECIRNDLRTLFKISKKNANLIQKAFLSAQPSQNSYQNRPMEQSQTQQHPK